MDIYVLTEYDAEDNSSSVLGAFSSIEEINDAITGKTYINDKFKDGSFDSKMGNYRNCWLHMTKVTLDNKEM